MRLTDRDVIAGLMKKYRFSAAKGLGQNFITADWVCPRMAEEAVPDKSFGALEIGPGIGVLTKELSAAAGKTVAVELDKRLLPVLRETLDGCDNVETVSGDALEIDLRALLAEKFGTMPVIVCANLPYYITTPILMRLLEEKLPLESITVMVQKEAARRFCSQPGSRECGAVSAAIWYYSTPEVLFDVPRDCFFPSPEVDSSVIRLTVNKNPPVETSDEKQFFGVVKAAFAQRRKTLANSISSSLGLDKSEVSAVLEAAGIPPAQRAEKLTLEEYAGLADAMKEKGMTAGR